MSGARHPRFAPSTLLAAAWTVVALRRARHLLRRDGLEAQIAGPPRMLPTGAERGVQAVLRRVSPTCLERATVLQAWLAAHGVPRDVVVGVTREGGALKAHAWVDQRATPADAGQYREIHRIPARPRPAAQHGVAGGVAAGVRRRRGAAARPPPARRHPRPSSASAQHRGMTRYHVTVVSSDPSHTAEQAAVEAVLR